MSIEISDSPLSRRMGTSRCSRGALRAQTTFWSRVCRRSRSRQSRGHCSRSQPGTGRRQAGRRSWRRLQLSPLDQWRVTDGGGNLQCDGKEETETSSSVVAEYVYDDDPENRAQTDHRLHCVSLSGLIPAVELDIRRNGGGIFCFSPCLPTTHWSMILQASSSLIFSPLHLKLGFMKR